MVLTPDGVAETLTVEVDWLQEMMSEEAAARVGVEKSERTSSVSVALQAPDCVAVTIYVPAAEIVIL
jgi:hypothetical protein